MKKNHSQQHPINPEALYAQVNKPRKVQRQPHPETTAHADVNVGGPSSKARPEETIYADINVGGPSSKARSEQIIYTDVNVGGLSSKARSEETIYADVNVGGPSSKARSEETIYADVNVGGPSSKARSKETVYADVNVGESNSRTHPEGMVHAGARTENAKTPLTRDYIAAQLLKNPAVQASTGKVHEWCDIVYGNEHILNKKLLQALQDPTKAEEILWKVAENPESPGPLAGKKMLGIKNRERQTAEEGFSSLCNSLEQYVSIVQKTHKDLIREHERRQRHERGEDQEKQLERRAHHHAKEKQQAVGEQGVQQRKHTPKQGMAMAM